VSAAWVAFGVLVVVGAGALEAVVVRTGAGVEVLGAAFGAGGEQAARASRPRPATGKTRAARLDIGFSPCCA
jgi:hypothetical protein